MTTGRVAALVAAGPCRGPALSPALARTEDERRALVQVGCLTDAGAGRPAVRTAIRCFQKSRGEAPTGALTGPRSRAVLEAAARGGTAERGERHVAEAPRGEDLPEFVPRFLVADPPEWAWTAPKAEGSPRHGFGALT